SAACRRRKMHRTCTRRCKCALPANWAAAARCSSHRLALVRALLLHHFVCVLSPAVAVRELLPDKIHPTSLNVGSYSGLSALSFVRSAVRALRAASRAREMLPRLLPPSVSGDPAPAAAPCRRG